MEDVPVRLTQLVVAAAGAFYTSTGVALLVAPRWFFENVGDFPPYNRHYAGDAGTFILPLGVVLLFAAARPWRHRWVIAIAAAVSTLHAGNHAYDAVRGDESAGDLVALVVIAALVAVAFFKARRTADP